ncbi:glycosyltransferase [Bacillus songklensis]|uniref:Glycosyltransferase n=1 Tax=Bacillus songklensis TaxID=1069116 RepID=A0ABV8B678_9BACI
MDYSVLTSVYYKEDPEYLKLSVLSMLNQTVPTNDFVIVKDGPLTDELEDVLRDFEKKYTNINIISLSENVGLGSALNAGLNKCKNELVARMDTDDIAFKNRCQLQLEEFASDPELDIVGSFMYEFYDNPEQFTAIKRVPITHKEIYKFAKRRNPFNHPTVMYKKSTILSNGGYSTLRRGQDIELFTRLLYQGCKGKNIDKPLVKFRTNDNMYKRRKSWSTAKNYIGVIYKSWKMGYAGFFDLMYVFTLQTGLLVIPTPLGKWIFRKFFRR